MSPNLFKLYINDLPELFGLDCDPPSLIHRKISCLFFADDLILLSKSPEGLQKLLTKLDNYCKKWNLTVNVNKTKILIFNVTGKLLKMPFTLSGKSLECVQNYKYLGVYFTASGSFTMNHEESYKKSLKAYFKLTKITQNLTSGSTLFHLFDSTVKPVLLYGSEIWGLKLLKNQRVNGDSDFTLETVAIKDRIENLQVMMCRHFLGVNKKSVKLAIYGDTGRYPLYLDIIINAVKYLNRLNKLVDNPLLSEAFMCNKNLFLAKKDCWYANLLSILTFIGVNVADMPCISKLKIQLQNRFNCFWKESVCGMSKASDSKEGKLISYRKFKTTNCFEPYLDLVVNKKTRSSLAKFRISAHRLNIELGRYQKVKRDKRICGSCDLNVIEDEIHFLSTCPKYTGYREVLFAEANKYCVNFRYLNDEAKFIWLMSAENKNIIQAVGTYLKTCFEVRENT
jgi:hypothetical protein